MGTAPPSASLSSSIEEAALLRAVIEEHAAIERLAGSTGEFESAQLLARQLEAVGAPARVEPATFLKGWAAVFAGAMVVPTVGAAIGHRVGRLPFALASLAVAGLVAEDIDNGPRYLRRALGRRRATTNVVAELGAHDAPVTLVVLAHHDAARTAHLFDQRAQRLLHRLFPKLIEGIRTSPPQWWPAIAAPLLAAAGLLTGRRGLRRAGAVASAAGIAVLGDIARGKVVPGANDNLSGVAVLVGLAERLRERPIDGLRVLLVSAGAEEELQGGIYGFLDDHADELDPATTWFLVPDTVGSPQLVMLEGEGPVLMHDYDDGFRELVAEVAAQSGVPLERDLRSRFSTDAIVPSRAGFRTVALVSLAPWRAPSNYHLPTDTPANIDFSTVIATVELTEQVARRLAKPSVPAGGHSGTDTVVAPTA